MPPVPEDEDAAAVRRVLAGDPAAFTGIVQRWQGRLINLAWRFSRDRTAAEDMAQEAFVKAFRALHTFRGESAFSTWLTAIAMNVYRSWLRDREPLPVDARSDRGSAAPSTDPLTGLQARERASTRAPGGAHAAAALSRADRVVLLSGHGRERDGAHSRHPRRHAESAPASRQGAAEAQVRGPARHGAAPYRT